MFVKNEKAVAVPRFSKDAIMKSKRFSHRRDALSFLLKDGVEYSIQEIETILTNYYVKGQVK